MKTYLYAILLSLVLFSCSEDDTDNDANASCNAVTAISQSNIDVDKATLQWTQEGATAFTVEYGVAGFNLGSGTQLTATSRQAVLGGLDQNTTYDYYVRANCGDTSSDFSGPATFTTLVCPAVTIGQVDVGQDSVTVSWFAADSATAYSVEYGLAGFTVGTGIELSTNTSSITINELLGNTTYDIYVRTNCSATNSEDTSKVVFTTSPVCATPTSFSGAPTAPGTVDLFWNEEGETAWRIEYGLSGFSLGTGDEVNTSQTFITITGLQTETVYEFYIQSNCGSNGLGEFLGPLPLVTN